MQIIFFGSFPSLSCEFASVDVSDVLGTVSLVSSYVHFKFLFVFFVFTHDNSLLLEVYKYLLCASKKFGLHNILLE